MVCAQPAPRAERIARADAAFAGTLVGREGSVLTFRVERVVKGPIAGAELRVRDEAHLSSGALALPVGARTGLLLREDAGDVTNGDRADYVTNLCLTIGADDLETAAAAAPCAAGDRPAVRSRGRRHAFGPRVLGCGRTPAGIAFQLVGSRLPGGRARPCLELVRLPGGPAAGCGDGRIRGADGVDVDGRAGRLISGTTAGRRAASPCATGPPEGARPSARPRSWSSTARGP
jgi:hypothetical protein